VIRLTSVGAVRARVLEWRAQKLKVGFVPTMGNLHAGHMSLLAAAREHADRIIASIFVNPLQFGQGEDYNQYPRTPVEDEQLLTEAGCDALFVPDVAELYPEGGVQATLVSVRGLSDILCGAFRPGHFDGVATVVAKLFGIVQPDVAVFGEKDFQQYTIIRKMTAELAMPVEVIGAPTVRAPDGLALSSRNRYLSPAERERAPAIHRALRRAVERLVAGERDIPAIEAEGRAALEAVPFRVDYFSVRQASTLAPATEGMHDLVVLTAVRLGKARLLDNLRVRWPCCP
jgi:pantoate--beta-alanine ligase